MLQKKVCMLGASSVGKTSLVRRFVYNVFSDRYLTTIGVRIDRKVVTVGHRDASLVIWDIQGEDRFAKMLPTYLRGASGCLLVADGTRAATVETALDLAGRVCDVSGPVPALLLLNKADLAKEWELQAEDVAWLRRRGWNLIQSSARLGTGVEKAFAALTEQMLDP